jgi:ketosteroid isomerase-like protein
MLSMMRNWLAVSLLVLSCQLWSGCSERVDSIEIPSKEREIERIDSLLDVFHLAAAKADFDAYFGFYTEQSIFTGTDASERWNKSEFMAYAKPYFDRGKAWSFTAVQRQITLHESGQIAWFDELLDTQMKICRGSGVLVKQGQNWKIEQYILSMTIPNEVAGTVIEIKSPLEDAYLDSIAALTKQN